MVDVIGGTEHISANFEVRHFSIERLLSRLTTPYDSSAASNIAKLLTPDAEEFDKFHNMLDDVIESHWVLSADDISLDQIGALLETPRRTGENDEDYRNRLRSTVSSLIGGGTKAQLRATIKEIIPGLTDADITIEDEYLTGTHGVGDPSHFAHFRVLINAHGFPFDAGALFDELTKAKAAGVTMDTAGPVFRETQIVTDFFISGAGVLRKETQVQNDAFRFDFSPAAYPESQGQLDPESLGPVDQHFVNLTDTESLNLVYSHPEAQVSANFTI